MAGGSHSWTERCLAARFDGFLPSMNRVLRKVGVEITLGLGKGASGERSRGAGEAAVLLGCRAGQSRLKVLGAFEQRWPTVGKSEKAERQGRRQATRGCWRWTHELLRAMMRALFGLGQDGPAPGEAGRRCWLLGSTLQARHGRRHGPNGRCAVVEVQSTRG